MKKLIFLISIFVTTTFYSKGQTSYEDAYTLGFQFGYDYMNYMVQEHPEYGATMGAGVFQSPTGNPVPFPNYNNVPVSIGSPGYSANMAGQIVINHLYASGGISYLASQSFIDDFHLGLYNGFMDALASWLLNNP